VKVPVKVQVHLGLILTNESPTHFWRCFDEVPYYSSNLFFTFLFVLPIHDGYDDDEWVQQNPMNKKHYLNWQKEITNENQKFQPSFTFLLMEFHK
jgi:hypothetical protein